MVLIESNVFLNNITEDIDEVTECVLLHARITILLQY